MSATPGYLELDLAGADLRRLLDGVVVDPLTGAAALAPVPAGPEPIGEAVDSGAALSGPAGIAVDPEGAIFVADPAHHRILRIGTCETEGAALRCVTGPGTEPGSVDTPRGVAIGPRRRLFVADSGNDRVQAFDLATLQVTLVIGGIGEPWELAVDAGGGLYVVGHRAGRVVKFDIDGAPLPQFGATVDAQPAVPSDPVSVAIVNLDGTEQLVVVEGAAGGRLLVYDLDGTFDAARTQAWTIGLNAVLGGASAAAVAVGDARLYVGESGTGGVLAFTLDGSFLGRSPDYSAGATGLAIDGAGRLLIHPGTGRAVRLAGEGAVAAGSLRIGPIALGRADAATAWQRLHAEATLGDTGHVQLFTLTRDVPDDPPPLPIGAPTADATETPAGVWRAAPLDVTDVLALNAPERYLWIGARLDGGGGPSPLLTRIRVDYNGEGWLPLLPAVHSRNDESRVFLQRLLALTESALDDEQALLDDLPRLMGAASAPDGDDARWLDWLSGWLAFDLDERWSEQTRRAAVAGAFELSGRRGTASGLRDLIGLTLGVDVRVREPSAHATLWDLGGGALGFTTMLAGAEAQGAVLGTTARLGGSDLIHDDEFGRPLFEELAGRFCVDVRASDVADPGVLDELRALVDRERPAETEGHVCVIGPRARVGMQSQIGVDAIVADEPAPLRLGADSPLGTGSALSTGPANGPARIGDPLRVGRTRLT